MVLSSNKLLENNDSFFIFLFSFCSIIISLFSSCLISPGSKFISLFSSCLISPGSISIFISLFIISLFSAISSILLLLSSFISISLLASLPINPNLILSLSTTKCSFSLLLLSGLYPNLISALLMFISGIFIVSLIKISSFSSLFLNPKVGFNNKLEL